MFQLIYTSTALTPLTSKGLTKLLDKARERNPEHEVTGMLLCRGGSFMQILEGPGAGVNLIFASIQGDIRHSGVTVQHTKAIFRREFKDLTMGFIDTSAWPEQPAGVTEYLRGLPEFTSAPTGAKRYLRLFQSGLVRR
jgi:hypothetical protein